ncbi:hypothetical protein AAC387_Pa02g5181 [Persea americana]
MSMSISMEEAPNGAATNLPCNCLISSAFRHLAPFPSIEPKVSDNIRNLHISIASAADRCIQTLHTFAAENPLVRRLLTLSKDFRNLSRIRYRNPVSPNSFSAHNFAAILPGDSVAGVVVANGILNFLNIYNSLLVIRLVLTWFPNSPPAIVAPLSTLCDPYLNIFRGIIPPLGGTLDLSPILAFLVLNAFTSTAAALPAELPATGASQHLSSARLKPWNLTTMQQKWMRRICGKRSKNSDESK